MTGRDRIEVAAKEAGWTSERVPHTRRVVAYRKASRYLEVIYTPKGRVGCIIGGGLAFSSDNTRKAEQVIAYLQQAGEGAP
ncbi:hypothetical protein [Mycobacterium intracellulare]|uniref:hypothetical protein n=1 Tax=Mycobacterium intracellulare TaxID=1767 RepID=UPI001CF296FB|nr:hypothetical protein [Mycobacterium intracellulare]UCN12741.1 hypothetical protein LFT50_27855 [Mycobacterium intracellulare subsp. chimaera]